MNLVFFSLLLFVFYTSTTFSLWAQCTDTWETVSAGNYTGNIWSVNGGPPQNGPPDDDACVFINHDVLLDGTMDDDHLLEDSELTIAAGATLTITNDFNSLGTVNVLGNLIVNTTLTLEENASWFVQAGGVVTIGNDLELEDCGSSMVIDGFIEVDNTFENGGSVSGSGYITAGNDTQSGDCCSSLSGTLTVCSEDAEYDGCGTVESSVTIGSTEDCDVVLAATQLKLQAKQMPAQGHIKLSWQTSMTGGGGAWHIMRMVDAEGFRLIDILPYQEQHVIDYRDEIPAISAKSATYQVSLTDENGSQLALSQPFTLLLNSPQKPFSVRLSTDNSLKLQATSESVLPIKVCVYNTLGQSVLTKEMHEPQISIPLQPRLPGGTYIIHAVSRQHAFSEKIRLPVGF